MPTLNRRDFLRALGITGGASALAACGLDNNRYSTPVETLLPYVVKPDQVVPGTFTFFATTLTRGPHAQTVTARHRDGRVTMLSANFGSPAAPAPTGPAVSTASFFELQQVYSPDRIKAPQAKGAEIAWDAGLGQLTEAVKAAKAAGKKVAYLGGYKSGAVVSLIRDLTAGEAYFWEPAGYAALAKASEALFGKRTLPFYALDRATYILSFGAPFLGGWGDSDIEDRFAKARNPNIGHTIARFALVAPHRDQTGAKADDFFAAAPGSEVTVARAIAGLVAQRKGASDAIKALIGSVSAEDAAKASGLTAEQITAIAEQFASHSSVALPGNVGGTTDLAVATYLINLAAGSAGTTFTLGGYDGPIALHSEIEALLAACAAGQVGVLLLDDANPVYALGAAAKDALSKADLLVSLSSHGSESSALAGLILPTAATLEDWGDEAPVAGLRLLRQPAMTALHGQLSLGDVLLKVGRDAGLQPLDGSAVGFGPASWREYLAQTWERTVYSAADGSFTDFWERSVIHGYLSRPVDGTFPSIVAGSYTFTDAPIPGAGDLVLHVRPHPFKQDGRYSNEPWAQEVGEPMTGQVWGSWIEISDALAAKLGLQANSLVELATSAGKVQVGVVPYKKGVRDDVIVLTLGGGHEAFGRYANGYGVNAFALVAGSKDPSGAAGLGPIKAQLTPLAGEAGLVHTFAIYGTSDQGRHFGVHVNAEKLAKVGDAPAAHAGELTGIHHLELDKRLTDQGITDFYGLPDHPTYRFGLTVDTNACTGCGACSVACYAENNLPTVGKKKVAEGREMAWIRINRYWEDDIGGQDDVRFVPMMCQQCGHAGCENVCPVLATYHNLDGLNAMVYNRCVGTRYCSNACPFSVRRFNYHTYLWPEPFNLQLNPDVSVRTMGVMEKCTFCVQRLRSVKAAFKSGGNFTATVPSEAWESVPACVEACPSQALVFGNLKDENSKVSKSRKSARTYEPLQELNVFSAVNYLAKASFHDDPTAHHGGGHGGGHSEDAAHGEAKPAAEGHGSGSH